jgi:hypothetical protein
MKKPNPQQAEKAIARGGSDSEMGHVGEAQKKKSQQSKMRQDPNTKLVSVRMPVHLVEEIDQHRYEFEPFERPNRSQWISQAAAEKAKRERKKREKREQRSQE